MYRAFILLPFLFCLFSCSHEEVTEPVKEPKKIHAESDRQNLSIIEEDVEVTLEKLEGAVSDVRLFFTNRDKLKKTNYFVKATGVFEENNCRLFFYISKQAEALPKDKKGELFESAFIFWRLRAKANGLGKHTNISILNEKGKLLAENEGKKLIFK